MVDRLGRYGNGIDFQCLSYLYGAVPLLVVVVLTCSAIIKTLLIGCQGVLFSALWMGNMTAIVSREDGSNLWLGVRIVVCCVPSSRLNKIWKQWVVYARSGLITSRWSLSVLWGFVVGIRLGKVRSRLTQILLQRGFNDSTNTQNCTC